MLRGTKIHLAGSHLRPSAKGGPHAWMCTAQLFRKDVTSAATQQHGPTPPPSGNSNVPCRRWTAAAAASGSAPGVAKVDAPRIFVLGGGFGGLYAAIRLDSLLWPKNTKPSVTLIDQNDRFLFKPLMYELLNKTADESEVAPEYSSLLSPYNVKYIQSKVSKVQPSEDDEGGGTITLSDGTALQYDWLVLALGADTNLDLAEGAKKHAIGFSTLKDLNRVDATLTQLELSAAAMDSTTPKPLITIVGAGYAGVELAVCVAERMKGCATVHLLSPNGEIMPEQNSQLVDAAMKSLRQVNVHVRTAFVEKVAAGRTASTSSDLGKQLTLNVNGSTQKEQSDLVLWTAGLSPSTGKQRDGFPFPVSARGTTATDATLRVPGHPRVFAIGDTASAAPPSSATEAEAAIASSPTAQVALQQADYVAWNIWASINDRPLLPFKYQHLGTMMALGRASGAVALNLPVPTDLADAVQRSPVGQIMEAVGVTLQGGSGGVTVEGPLGALLRRGAYWYRQPTNDQKLRVGGSWLNAGLEEVRKSAGKSSGSGGFAGPAGGAANRWPGAEMTGVKPSSSSQAQAGRANDSQAGQATGSGAVSADDIGGSSATGAVSSSSGSPSAATGSSSS